MPSLPHTRDKRSAPEERISQLLQLKRCERPDAAFWIRFEKELRAKQLASLVRVQPLHQRLARACLYLARKVGAPTLAACAVATTLFIYTQDLREGPAPKIATASEGESEPAAPLFIVDKLQPPLELDALMNEARLDYTVRTIERSSQTPSYQLEAAPVTLTSRSLQASESQELGAKVLKSRSQF